MHTGTPAERRNGRKKAGMEEWATGLSVLMPWQMEARPGKVRWEEKRRLNNARAHEDQVGGSEQEGRIFREGVART